jgi:hypothetical protein
MVDRGTVSSEMVADETVEHGMVAADTVADDWMVGGAVVGDGVGDGVEGEAARLPVVGPVGGGRPRTRWTATRRKLTGTRGLVDIVECGELLVFVKLQLFAKVLQSDGAGVGPTRTR